MLTTNRVRWIRRLLLGITLGTPGWLNSQAVAQMCPNEIAGLLAGDGAEEDWFGFSVSMSGDTAVFGAHRDDDNGNESGSAYVFTRSDGVWTRQAKLIPNDGTTSDYFGYAVSICDDTAVIGAPFDSNDGRSGSAYVFTRSDGVWTQQAKLIPNDGEPRDLFGYSVSIDADTALIGAKWDDDHGTNSGAAYVFTRSGGVWTQQAKLLPSDGSAGDTFGISVSINSDTAIIGSYQDDDNGTDSGSAYVFTRSGGIWTQQTKLLASDGAPGDTFATAVTIDADTAVIGANGNDDNGNSSGSAYVFIRNGAVWTQQAKLLPSNGGAADFFGSSVSLSADTTVVGAIYFSDSNVVGSAYVFTRSNGVWTQQANLLASDREMNDYFGCSVAIGAETAVIGAYGDDENGNNAGSVYAFELACSPCPADLTGDGNLNFFDVSVFLVAFSSQQPDGDFNDDGIFNFFDVSAFLVAFNAGCP